MKIKRVNKNNFLLNIFVSIIVLTPIYIVLYKIYIPHISSFGCFDECMNYGGGYFISQGKSLYSQIFFNHQPIAGFLSFFVQKLTHPSNLYEFLLKHGQAVLLFGFIFNIFIVARYKIAGFLFVVFYELSKYYLFGNRFLAESFIVYPIVYLAGLMFFLETKQKIYRVEFVLTAVFSWFVLFMREPFAFVAIFQLLFILRNPNTKVKKLSYLIFGLLTLISLITLPLNEYLFSILTVSYKGTLANEANSTNLYGIGILKVLFYPFYSLFFGKWNEFRILLVGFSAIFSISGVFLLLLKRYKLVFLSIFLLGLLNIRYVLPGTIFYSAFHMMDWFGVIILFTFLFLEELRKKEAVLSTLLYGFIFITLFMYLSNPNNFIRHNINQQEEFLTNFGPSYSLGETVKALSTPDQTFFIDGGNDDLNVSYWVSQRTSPYQYSWFVYFAPGFQRYIDARDEMFTQNPPDFYYGKISKGVDTETSLPNSIADKYIRLNSNGKKSNLFMKKNIVRSVSNDQWNKAKEFGIDKPKDLIRN